MRDFAHLERANDVALFLDDALGKIAPQELPDVDANGVAILQRRGGAHRCLADHDRTIRFQHFERADALVVIAKNLQQARRRSFRAKAECRRLRAGSDCSRPDIPIWRL